MMMGAELTKPVDLRNHRHYKFRANNAETGKNKMNQDQYDHDARYPADNVQDHDLRASTKDENEAVAARHKVPDTTKPGIDSIRVEISQPGEEANDVKAVEDCKSSGQLSRPKGTAKDATEKAGSLQDAVKTDHALKASVTKPGKSTISKNSPSSYEKCI